MKKYHTRFGFKRFNRMVAVQNIAKKLRESGMSVAEIKKEINDMNCSNLTASNLYPKVIEW